MKIRVVASNRLDTKAAISEVLDKSKETRPSLVFVGFNVQLEGETISTQLSQHFNCPIIGGSSYKGALCINEDTTLECASLCLFLLSDPAGNYGVGHQEIKGEAHHAAREALDMALYASGRGYESPTLIWCILPPGQEESIIEGFSDVVGHNVPVFGGSSADNDIAGQWQQITDIASGKNQISVAVLYPSQPVACSFSSGYEATDTTIKVTEADNRLVKSLNNQPAAETYNAITQGAILDHLAGGNVHNLTSLHPLGQKIKTASGIEDYLLCHPKSITSNGEITLFSRVTTNETLHLMRTNKTRLRKRAHRVIKNSIDLLPDSSVAKGVILIYCASCMRTVEDELNIMLQEIKESFQNLPIFGIYTFGEQGCFFDGINRHGNLMISAVAFS